MEVTEEVETVSLQPIGRGVVDLEPAGTSPAAPLPSATIPRSATMRRPPNSAAPPGYKPPAHHFSQTLYPQRSARPAPGPAPPFGLAPPQRCALLECAVCLLKWVSFETCSRARALPYSLRFHCLLFHVCSIRLPLPLFLLFNFVDV